jgi:hypothetical protein
MRPNLDDHDDDTQTMKKFPHFILKEGAKVQASLLLPGGSWPMASIGMRLLSACRARRAETARSSSIRAWKAGRCCDGARAQVSRRGEVGVMPSIPRVILNLFRAPVLHPHRVCCALDAETSRRMTSRRGSRACGLPARFPLYLNGNLCFP